jgi:hypothetical protein
MIESHDEEATEEKQDRFVGLRKPLTDMLIGPEIDHVPVADRNVEIACNMVDKFMTCTFRAVFHNGRLIMRVRCFRCLPEIN